MCFHLTLRTLKSQKFWPGRHLYKCFERLKIQTKWEVSIDSIFKKKKNVQLEYLLLHNSILKNNTSVNWETSGAQST